MDADDSWLSLGAQACLVLSTPHLDAEAAFISLPRTDSSLVAYTFIQGEH